MKYTCAPGFQGRVWLDFAEACLDDANRTNNVGFRLSGAVSAAATGDTGIGGATPSMVSLGRLPAARREPAGHRRGLRLLWRRSASPDGVAATVNCVSPPARPSLVQRAGGPRRGYRGNYGLQVRLSGHGPAIGSIGMAAAIRKARESSSVCRSGMARFLPVVTGATDGDGISLYPAATGHL